MSVAYDIQINVSRAFAELRAGGLEEKGEGEKGEGGRGEGGGGERGEGRGEKREGRGRGERERERVEGRGERGERREDHTFPKLFDNDLMWFIIINCQSTFDQSACLINRATVNIGYFFLELQ
jgi:hypothetical protein